MAQIPFLVDALKIEGAIDFVLNGNDLKLTIASSGDLDMNSIDMKNIGAFNGHTIPGGLGTLALTSDLHTQNTDTGTSATSFVIDSGSNASTLDASVATQLRLDSKYLVLDSGDSVGIPGGILFGGVDIARSAYVFSNVEALSASTTGYVQAAPSEAVMGVLVSGSPVAASHVLYNLSTASSNYYEVLLWDGSAATNRVLKLDYDGKLSLSDNGTDFGTFDPTGLAANRAYTLPDKTGVMAVADSGKTVVTNLNADQVDGKDSTDLMLLSGTQAMSGNMALGSNRITGLATPTAGTDAVTKNYVDSALEGLDWQESVLDKAVTSPGGEAAGQRYLIDDVGSDAITAVVIGTEKFTVLGDLKTGGEIADGDIIRVGGSTGNDGWWTVVSTDIITTPGSTIIEVSEDVTDATVDGTIYYGTAGDNWVTDAGSGPGKIVVRNTTNDGWNYITPDIGTGVWEESDDRLWVFNTDLLWVLFGSLASHTHDDRYYTETEVDTITLSGKKTEAGAVTSTVITHGATFANADYGVSFSVDQNVNWWISAISTTTVTISFSASVTGINVYWTVTEPVADRP